MAHIIIETCVDMAGVALVITGAAVHRESA
jgi:hypothetical protein